MGQKIHPYGFRVGITRGWQSRWFADKSRFGTLIVEDVKIREYVKKRLKMAGIARAEIERTGDEVRLLLHTARPGLVIGRKHTEVDRLRDDIQELTGKRVTINVREISNPDTSAQLLAEGVAAQLLKRISFRRAMRRTLEAARSAGALGVKIMCAGRLGGAEMSRRERYVDGKLPLHTLKADIEYGFAEARTTYGTIGVKVWLYKGDIKEA
ncbi:MAG: 30S ribosomal protein S3 [Planctomycetota bacterium]